jgi:precorrin-6B methylase 2
MPKYPYFRENKKPNMDPIGQAIFNFYFHNDTEKLRVDSNYTEDEEIDPAHFFRKKEELPALEKTAIELCRGKVLDVGAGAGCHTLILQDMGIAVTAIEKSELASMVMEKRGVASLVTDSIFNFKGQEFDTILMLMNGAGLAGTLDGLKSLFTHLKTLIHSDGQILMDSTDIQYLFTEEDGSLWIDLANDQYYGEMTYTVTYKNDISDTFPWLFVDFTTLAEIAAESGLEAELVFEGADDEYLARLTPKF